MSSEIIVVIVLMAIAVLFIFWVRSKSQANEPERVDEKANEAANNNR